jgi:hypothetical protein
MNVIQFAGQTNCTGTNNQATIVPGVDTPSAEDTWAPFMSYNGDQNITNYKIVNGVLIYIPTNVAVPNPDMFQGSLFQGLLAQGLTEAAINLSQAFPLVDKFITTYPLAISQYWTGLKATNPTWLTPTVITMAESLAVQYNIPLINV